MIIEVPVTDIVMCWNARQGTHPCVLQPRGKDVSYACGLLPPRYPMPATRNNHLIRPLLKGYWALYWYRCGLLRTF